MFKSKDLSVLAYANGFTLWHYTTTDSAAEVGGAGYFNDAADMLRVGDMIFANTDTDGKASGAVFYTSKNHAGEVSAYNMAGTSEAA